MQELWHYSLGLAGKLHPPRHKKRKLPEGNCNYYTSVPLVKPLPRTQGSSSHEKAALLEHVQTEQLKQGPAARTGPRVTSCRRRRPGRIAGQANRVSRSEMAD